MHRSLLLVSLVSLWSWAAYALAEEPPARVFRAGAFAIDITPEELPVLVNGGITSRSADRVVDRLHARCLVLDDGATQIAIVVADSCMLPRSLLDEAKEIAAKATGIPTNRMMISATHTHSAPSAMGALGTDADEAYVKFLPDRLARGIALAQKNLEPARIGWASEREPKNIYCRHWLMKDGTAQTNPFSGKSNDQVQMNPGNGNPNKIKPISPVDDEVSVVSIQAKDGRPIALLANYSTHYAGSPALSADYFGVFAEKIGKLIGADAVKDKPPFVGIMSNGTSGDANCLDFSRPEPRKFDYFSVAEDTAQAALAAYKSIKYYDWVPIVMEEGLLTLNVRMPTADEVVKAKEFLATDEGKKLQTIPAVYARETVLLSESPPTRELKIQAIRLGELGIGTMPNEVFGITGLTIKKESPLKRTFNIELANGAEGYIPPPDQHKLGGYTTWRARTSLLEEEAEPKIRAQVLELLGKVASVKSGTGVSPVTEQSQHRPEADATEHSLRAGAYAIDITPEKFSVIVNGMFTERTASSAHDKLHARCLVLEDGHERIALAVVDNLMIPRELIDEAKQLASKATGIRTDRIMVSATHTHSAPSVMGCLGSGVDQEYPAQLVPAIARGIELAAKNVQPAKLGFTAIDARGLTNCRRWIRRPDAIGGDPFGEPTIRAMMHPGYQNPGYVGPAGPIDSQLSLVSIQTADGEPLAVLANYSMHYFGSAPVSADYFGVFCEKLAAKIGRKDAKTPFVAILSQGTSGDQHWMDYSQPQTRITLDEYSQQLADIALKAYEKIEYRSDISLSMAETKLKLRRRTPDEQRLAWAKEMVAKLGDKLPQSQPEIYAREAVYLHDEPERELVLQAIRLGDVGIATFPNEVFGITGLKIKLQSPLAHTFNIELANGAEGYIPPPEQHRLGGYTTWPARTAGLEVEAEPKIVAALLRLLEEVSGEKRRALPALKSRYQDAVLASTPAGYWSLDDIRSASAASAAPDGAPAAYGDGVALYLEGVPFNDAAANRAAQFAGGRLLPSGAKLSATYSVEFWFENRLPNNARPVTTYLFSRGPDGDKDCPGDHLGVMGSVDAANAGRLLFFNGNKLNHVVTGKTAIAPYTWNHVAMVRDGRRVRVYLNGQREPEIDAEVEISIRPDVQEIFFAGRSDNFANLAGKLDEIALFDRALTADEIAMHFAAAEFEPAQGSGAGVSPVTDQGQPRPEAGATVVRQVSSPVSPEDSLKYFHLRPGLKIELVAAEPLVRDPVAFDWGPDGKLWVVEYLDYPTGIDGKGKGGGRVVFLEDTDGDGRYDKSTVFIDELNFPTGVMAWRGGVLITAAPDILFAQDTDGDGKADKREALYTGFHEANQQLRVNGLRWGLDNWIYCASGSHHGDYGKDKMIKSARTGEATHVGSRDFRIRPDEGLIDPQSGPSQFGRNRDAWGNWFGVQNAKPMWHYVLDDRYLRRNPHVAPPPSQILLSDVPGQRPVFAVSQPGKFHHASQAGRFTSANSAMIYNDELLGQEFIGNSFVSEPVHNLVHREIVERDGVTFKSHKPADEENTEFLASEDTWFRPTTIRTGPDGALWIADMYREVIEHPEWVSADLKPLVDTRNGTDRGRIYRIYPENAKPRTWPRLDKLSTQELVAQLESPSAALRDMAQIQIVTRKLKDAAGPLEFVVSEAERAESRLQALATLEGLGELRSERVAAAMCDDNVYVRREAVRLSETFNGAQILPTVLEHAKKRSDPVVQLQLAYTLGSFDTAAAHEALAKLLASDGGDPLIAAAAISSVQKKNVAAVLRATLASQERSQNVGQLLALAAALDEREAAAESLAIVLEPASDGYADWQLQAIDDLLAQIKTSFADWAKSLPDSGAEARSRLVKLLEWSQSRAFDENSAAPTRAGCVRLLGRNPTARDRLAPQLAELLAPRTPPEVQQAAVQAIGRLALPNTPELLLARWTSSGPALRQAMLDLLISSPDPAWTAGLLTAIEQQQVAAADIDASRRERLVNSQHANLRQRAAKALAFNINTDRQKVVESYGYVLQLAGRHARGKEIFAKRCSACHKVDGIGNEVGAEIGGLTDKSAGNLLLSILDPNRSVEPKFLSYTAVTTDGRVWQGMLAEESGGSLTLLDADGKRLVLLRKDIEELKASGKSLMPEGFEKDISPEQMADLVAYLQAALAEKP